MTDRPWPRPPRTDMDADQARDAWAAETVVTERPKWVLVNTVCGHLLAYSNHKQSIQATKNRLTIAGKREWRVEERDGTNGELAALIENERCAGCTLDKRTKKAMR
jgi:hypothetical protein